GSLQALRGSAAHAVADPEGRRGAALTSVRQLVFAGRGGQRTGVSTSAVAPAGICARAVGMEAGGRHALGAARESVERESASHRGLRADRRDRGAWRDAGAVPLRASGTWPRAARRLPAGIVRAPHARVGPGGISCGLVIRLLARGVEVRRARLPLLPAR